MAQGTIRIRVTFDETAGIHTVKSIITHPMETGLRKDGDGRLVPALFIREVVCEHNGKPIIDAEWSTAVSRNPYLAFELRGAARGDKVSIRWTDSAGDSDLAESIIA